MTVAGPSAARTVPPVTGVETVEPVQSGTDALLFALAGSRMALVAQFVVEVVRAVQIEPLPHAPVVVSGVINARGVLLPVIDMRRRLGLQPKAVTPDDHFIIVECGSRKLGLHVDRALDLMPIDGRTVEPLAEDTASPYIAGALALEDGVLLIYDLPTFLSTSEGATLDYAMSELAAAEGGSSGTVAEPSGEPA